MQHEHQPSVSPEASTEDSTGNRSICKMCGRSRKELSPESFVIVSLTVGSFWFHKYLLTFQGYQSRTPAKFNFSIAFPVGLLKD